MAAKPHNFLSPLLFFFILHLLPSYYSMSTVDLTALLDIKNSLTDIPAGHFFSTWNFTAPHPCSSFSGITCNSLGRVTVLSLGNGLSNSAGLAGSLPASLSKLFELTQLILFPGIVTGPIPPQLGRLTKLRVISLTNNRLTGSIPVTFSSLNYLHTLDLSHNHLTGSIPPSLTGLTQLKVLILAFNELSGELPANMSSQLLHLDLRSNRLNGKLPGLVPSTLRYLSLSDNLLWGPLSSGLESLSELVYLDLSMNHFTGPIPLSLFRPSLSSLLLQRNNLSSGVPQKRQIDGYDFTSSSSYGKGSIVDLSHNYLTGELTDILAGVESLFLNNNRLIGTVPEVYIKSVCSGTTRTLYLQHNFLSGFKLQGLVFPDTAAVCLSYNCMVPPVGLAICPATAGTMISRPTWQCERVKYGSSNIPKR